jgi:hypothetical protein
MQLLMHKVGNMTWTGVGAAVGVALFVTWMLIDPSGRVVATATIPDPAGGVGSESPGGLRVECRNDDESFRTSATDWEDGNGPRRRRFLRIRVYNDGPRTALGCLLTLRKVTEITPGGSGPTDYAGPGLLIWSGDSSASHAGKSLRRNSNPEVADLLYTVQDPDRDRILLKDEKYSPFLKYGKSYNFEVIATSENVSGIIKCIKVRFGGTWDDFEVLGD